MPWKTWNPEARFALVLERPLTGFDPTAVLGTSLARVVEAHPALEPLLDFSAPDPVEIARAVGMLSPDEEDTEDDLGALDWDAPEWCEASAGLAAVQGALAAVRQDPGSLARAVYDPGLRAEDVLADLEAIERGLLLAQQQETRFRFVTDVP